LLLAALCACAAVSAQAAGRSACGDGVVDTGEECDDGNTRDGDCCSSACKIEPDTDSAQSARAATTVRLRGARTPKLAKSTVSHTTSTTRKSSGMALLTCANISQRAAAKSPLIVMALDCSQRWPSFCGESARILA